MVLQCRTSGKALFAGDEFVLPEVATQDTVLPGRQAANEHHLFFFWQGGLSSKWVHVKLGNRCY